MLLGSCSLGAGTLWGDEVVWSELDDASILWWVLENGIGTLNNRAFSRYLYLTTRRGSPYGYSLAISDAVC